MAATTKPAAKAKPDKTICRWGEGRYFSPKTSKACTAAKAPKRELCAEHEKSMRAARKAAQPATTKAAKKAATSEERVARTLHRSTPPTPPRAPVARVNAPEQAPHLVQLVSQ